MKAAGDHGWIFAGDGNDSITVGDGNFNIWTGAGNDTIALGSGTDTVTAQGHATVSGGTHDLLIASGNASISVSGGNNDTFIGGSGHDSVNVVSGSSSVDFQFYASLSGSTATHDITGFAASDTIDLFNLTAAAPVVIGGNTVITLSDGSHITLNGYTGAVNINHTP